MKSKKYFKWIFVSLIILIVLSLLILGVPDMNGKKIAAQHGIIHPATVAHRGASYWAPETTRPAYLLAMAMSPDYVEMDVQRTKDNVLIAFHDDTLERTTNVAEVYPDRQQDPIGKFTWAELQKLDTGTWFNQKFPERARPTFVGLPILKFEELVDIVTQGNSSTGLYVETKCPELYPGIEAEIVELLKQKGWITAQGQAARPIIFESFNLNSVKQFKQITPEIPRSYLMNAVMYRQQGMEKLQKDAQEFGHAVGSIAHPRIIGPAHKKGLLTYFYTINKSWQMRWLLLWGADGFFTDRPDLGLHFTRKVFKIDVRELWPKIGY